MANRSKQLVLIVFASIVLIAMVAALVNRWHGNSNVVNDQLQNPADDRSGDPPDPQRLFDQRSPIRFTNIQSESGVDFLYYGAPTSDALMTEQNGGGIAVFDFDQDGSPDLFFSSGRRLDALMDQIPRHQLYRQKGRQSFVPCTETANLSSVDLGMGCAVDDYNNDGFPDLYLANYGTNRLWKNNGDGTFSEVMPTRGEESPLWGTSAAFADFNGDGNSDLYVVNYVDWTPAADPCLVPGQPDLKTICSPIDFDGQPDQLYRNEGDGRFLDISQTAGVALRPDGKGLALVCADLTGDQRPDVYVANDTTPNFLFENRGDMKFADAAVSHGAAISSDGRAGSGMGVACADYDGNGALDLFVTNFRNQVNDVYAGLNNADGFISTNASIGMDLVSRSPLSFGIVAQDFDADGWPDLFVANGHIRPRDPSDPEHEYAMNPQLIQNIQGRRFTDVSAAGGHYFQQKWIGRAVAVGDLDNDLDLDLVVGHLSAPAAILRNDSTGARLAVCIQLIGTHASRQALATTVDVTINGITRRFCVPSGGSFQVSHDPRLIIAAGTARVIDQVTVHWIGGAAETWRQLKVGQSEPHRLIQGRSTRPSVK